MGELVQYASAEGNGSTASATLPLVPQSDSILVVAVGNNASLTNLNAVTPNLGDPWEYYDSDISSYVGSRIAYKGLNGQQDRTYRCTLDVAKNWQMGIMEIAHRGQIDPVSLGGVNRNLSDAAVTSLSTGTATISSGAQASKGYVAVATFHLGGSSGGWVGTPTGGFSRHIAAGRMAMSTKLTGLVPGSSFSCTETWTTARRVIAQLVSFQVEGTTIHRASVRIGDVG